IGGYSSDTGEGILNIDCESTGPSPSKDDCENAQALGEVKNMAFDTRDKTFDGPGLCLTSPNIWFVYTPSCTGDATVSLLGSSFDTKLAVYEGDKCDLTSDDMIECNDDASSGVYQSEITFAASASEKYLIEIGGYGSDTGEGILNIRCESVATEDVPDLGDAPDSTNNFGYNMNAYSGVKANYPTVFNDDSDIGPFGPVHLNDLLVAYLGKKITAETEADKGTDEDGDNNIDPSSGSSNDDKGDDGVVLPLNLPTCRWTTFDYTVNVIDPDVDLYVNVWLDWNRDGDWDDTLDCAQGPAPEWAVQNQLLFDLSVGLNQITTPAILSWHPKNPEDIWMRITLSEQAWKGGSNPGEKGNAGSGPQDKYLYGETEDYLFTPDTSITVCEDFNGDGVINTDDLVAFTADWLNDCPE
ncbi:GEVED domain-containing protein, partial [Planctomycetota bacterium]